MTASKIEWTDRSDWNPIRGCSRVSPGCGGPGEHGGCYAEAMAARFSRPGQWGHGFAEMRGGKPRWTGKVALAEDRLALPLRWKKPARVFVSSTSDVFHLALSDADIDRIFAVMALCPHLTFQVLTKRAARMRRWFDLHSVDRLDDLRTHFNYVWCAMTGDFTDKLDMMPWPLPNVWLGVSVEDQERANERIPDLLETPAAVRFLSCEPLLGPIDLTTVKHRLAEHSFETASVLEGDDGFGLNRARSRIDWVIAGGESGPRARPMHPDWARSLRDQCAAAGVPFFFKQWGEWGPDDGHTGDGRDRILDGSARCAWWTGDDWRFEKNGYVVDPAAAKGSGEWLYRLGKTNTGRTLDGRTHDDFPRSPA